MKFKLGSDFYKALALFSQSGCPFTQAGSFTTQSQMSRPLTASSAATLGGTTCQPRENLRSTPSTADSDQRTLVPSFSTSMHPSIRPSTSTSSTWRSEPGVTTSRETAYDTCRRPAYPEKPHVSPFFSESNRLPRISDAIFQQHDARKPAQNDILQRHSFPSSSDPVAAAAWMAVSSGNEILQPAFSPAAPRPSTAPNFESQRLSQMLPPKRELPFKVSRSISGTSKRAPTSGQAESSGKDRTIDDQAAKITGPAVQDKQATVHVPSNAPRKAPAKHATKATRVTRNTAATSRSRRKQSVLKDDSPVPSVEELLRSSRRLSEKQSATNPAGDDAKKVCLSSNVLGTPAFKNNVAGDDPASSLAMDERHARWSEERPGAYQYSSIDTQALLARVDEREQRKNAKCKDDTESHEGWNHIPPPKRVVSDTSMDLAAQPHHDSGEELSMAGFREAASKSDITSGSSHVDIALLPKTTGVNAVCGYGTQENDVMPPSAQKPVEETSARSMNREDLGAPERPPLADISNAAQPGRSHTLAGSSMMALMNDPDFAKSPEIVKWADLPVEERDAALETWMCQQLESESFATLAKALEGKWQSILFGRQNVQP
jgi:hypothetical protein